MFGFIQAINYEVTSLSRCITGITKDKQKFYGSPGSGFFGGNGTYREGYPEEHRELLMTIRIEYEKPNPRLRIPIGIQKVDVRELALSINGREKVTNAFVSNLRRLLIGKRVELTFDPIDCTISLKNPGILIL